MHHLTALSCRQPEGLQLKGQLIGEGEGPEAARLLRSPWLHPKSAFHPTRKW